MFTKLLTRTTPEAKSFLPSAEGTEVLRGVRGDIAPEFHLNTAGWAIADADIEEHSRIDHAENFGKLCFDIPLLELYSIAKDELSG